MVDKGTYGRIPNVEMIPYISLPALTTLIVNLFSVELDWREWITIFMRLKCPSLLNFKFVSPSSTNICVPLKAFFTRSQPPLEALHLDILSDAPHSITPHNETAFVDILRILPSLVSLEVSGALATRRGLLGALAMNRSDGQGLCPLLKRTCSFFDNPQFGYIRLGIEG